MRIHVVVYKVKSGMISRLFVCESSMSEFIIFVLLLSLHSLTPMLPLHATNELSVVLGVLWWLHYVVSSFLYPEIQQRNPL